MATAGNQADAKSKQKVSGDAEMSEEQNLSPNGLQTETESEPEPDFSAKYEEQQEAKESDRLTSARSDSIRTALEEATKVIAQPVSTDTSVKLKDVQRRIGTNVDKLLTNLPKKIAKANLAETVGALTKLVPLMGEIDNLLTPRKSPQDLLDEIRSRAQKKLARKTNGKAAPTD